MKLTLRMEEDPDHEHLVLLFNLMVAAEVRATMIESEVEPDRAMELASSSTFGIAMLLDEATLEVNGKIYRPRIAFVDDKGNVLPGAAEFDFAHEYATVFTDDLEANDDFSIER